jgi:exodeoxyribonuclease III
MPRVTEWLTDVQPDVVLMQETKLADGAFPALEFAGLGYEAAHHGQGQWNGVAILSKVGIESVVANFADGEAPDAEARIVSATCGGVRVSSVYVPNGRSLDDDHYQYKLRWLARLRAHLDATSNPADAVIVGGDFNIAPAGIDVWDEAKVNGGTHVSEAEREALAHICEFGLTDLFREQHTDGKLFSWWDYRAGDFHQGRGMRIDLMLGTACVRDRLQFSIIDRNARKGTSPSDHAPVLVDLAD